MAFNITVIILILNFTGDRLGIAFLDVGTIINCDEFVFIGNDFFHHLENYIMYGFPG